jgi:hypothetical protein
MGQVIMPGGPFGSILEKSLGTLRASGMQSPVVFALGKGFENAALVINETRPLAWDFSSNPWYVGPTGPLGPHESVDFFIILGKDFPALRKILMTLFGRSTLPSKSVFAPWIITPDKAPGQNYQDILTDLAGKKGGFSTISVMFRPQPSSPPLEEAAALNLNLLITESPYIPIGTDLYSDMSRRGFLVRDGGPNSGPLEVLYKGVKSGIIDYTHSPASTYWYNETRAESIALGARLFNLVGGEPEVYSPSAWYQGEPGDTVHSHYAWANRFALKWVESMTADKEIKRFGQYRPRIFSVSRTGLGAMGRFASGILTFEPNPVFVFNAAQARANLILSGVDYYSTDMSQLFGGNFPLSQSLEVQQSWLSNIALLNLPLVIPIELLNYPWAKLNLDLKASLEPYYYSLAHSSSQNGEPLVAPLLYYFQDDSLARDRVIETMIGPYLLVASGVTPRVENLPVYLPKGLWYDLHNREIVASRASGGPDSSAGSSAGSAAPTPPPTANQNPDQAQSPAGDSSADFQSGPVADPASSLSADLNDSRTDEPEITLTKVEETNTNDVIQYLVNVPAKVQGLHAAPLMVRQGAIIPMIQDPSGPKRRKALLVFPGPKTSSFSLYEDNGIDLGYREDKFATTTFTLDPVTDNGPVVLTINPREGSYPGEEIDHRYWIEFVGLKNIGSATLDGEDYKRPNNEEQLHLLDSGWFSLGDGRLIFKTPAMDPDTEHKIVLN